MHRIVILAFVKLSTVRIRRYRCLLDLELRLESLTSLIGMNGSGKSAILRAIVAFYGEGGLIQAQDWYGADSSEEIEVALTFKDMSEDERASFAHYVGLDGQLQVARVWRMEDGRIHDALHGYHLAAPDFDPVRQADKGIAALHNNLFDSGKYPDLDRVTRADQVEEALQRWEAAHPERCEWVRDAGKFFGWNQVGGARLASASVCVYVPAVREAREDAAEGKGSALSKIVDLVLREELRKNPDLAELRRQTESRFEEILEKTRPALAGLAVDLSGLMAEFTPGSAVSLDWRPGTPALPDWPPIEAKLSEDGIETPVWAKGHGLQRSFIVSLLQRLAEVRARESTEEEPANHARHTLLLVEEPELYQHPLAARRFATVLRTLAEGNQGTQIIYSTHDPVFVSFDHFDAIRRVQKLPVQGGGPPATTVTSLSLGVIRTRLIELWALNPDVVTEESTRERLRTVLTPEVSEGFFARAIVLVEGEQDRAMLEGLAAARGVDLVAKGIALVPVGGKGNLDRALLVFGGFGIPTYLVFDADVADAGNSEQHARVNRVLMTLAGQPPEDFPASGVHDRMTVFADILEGTLRDMMGDEWNGLLSQCCEVVGLPLGRDVLKTGYGCREFIGRAFGEGKQAGILDDLLDRVMRL